MQVLYHNMDPIQESYLKEECILVDHFDKIIGHASKLDCHYKNGKLHRAFSVFLFAKNTDSDSYELLLQQRSIEKITFPGQFTNSCCSHPTYSIQELEESDSHIGTTKHLIYYRNKKSSNEKT